MSDMILIIQRLNDVDREGVEQLVQQYPVLRFVCSDLATRPPSKVPRPILICKLEAALTKVTDMEYRAQSSSSDSDVGFGEETPPRSPINRRRAMLDQEIERRAEGWHFSFMDLTCVSLGAGFGRSDMTEPPRKHDLPRPP